MKSRLSGYLWEEDGWNYRLGNDWNKSQHASGFPDIVTAFKKMKSEHRNKDVELIALVKTKNGEWMDYNEYLRKWV